MKKVNIICVGKIKEKFFREGITEYNKRLNKFVKLNIIELPDEATNNPSVAVKKESEQIIKNMKGYNILLDIGGELLDNYKLADIVDNAYIQHSEVRFILGGSCGVSDEVRVKVDKRISLGRVTYPHQLMRLILCEQIYRTFCIINKTPYHK